MTDQLEEYYKHGNWEYVDLTKLAEDGIGLKWLIMRSVVDACNYSTEHSKSVNGEEIFEYVNK